MNFCTEFLFHVRRTRLTSSERACCLLTDRCFTSCVICMWKGRCVCTLMLTRCESSEPFCYNISFSFLLTMTNISYGCYICQSITSLCVCVSSIQQVIDQNNGKEQVCDERDGWCVVGTTDKLRDIISSMIKKVVRAQKPRKDDIQCKECPGVTSFRVTSRFMCVWWHITSYVFFPLIMHFSLIVATTWLHVWTRPVL